MPVRRFWRVTELIELARTVERNPGVYGSHCDRVAQLAHALAAAAGCDRHQRERIRLAGLLHDVGKVFVPKSILDKPGPLSTAEYAQVVQHPELGAALITDRSLSEVSHWVLTHHERPDGLGYPLGLAAGELAHEARILSIADAYEAMTNDRPYCTRLSHDRACDELVAGAGTHFDEGLVGLFISDVNIALAR